MAYTVLARRYRSTTFDEVVGQEHVAQTLKKAIAADRIAHAFLFNGTRGVGKTSMARILAKALNCLSSDRPTPNPCNKCDSCLAIARGEDMDVIEIDAASNTGVDNVREVIENAQYRPARGRFKVFIVDEAHMLSKAAFNALLKTLEEPPSHVKFILATTEPEKILPTILSRCQRYDFRNIPTREIAAHLREICQKEKIDAESDALLLVAKAGAGSMRDALSLLDRLLSVGETSLTSDAIERLLGLPKSQLVFDLAQSIGDGDLKATLTRADAMVRAGLSVDGLIAALTEHLRNLLVARVCGPDSELVEAPGLALADLSAQAARFDPAALTQDIALLEELRRNIRQSQAGRALLDATLARLALAEQFASVGELLARLEGAGPGDGFGAAEKKKADEPRVVAPPSPRPPAPIQSAAPAPAPAPTIEAAPAPDDDDDDDDLPRPGKVWEGPSLKELLQQKPAPPPAPVAAPAPAALPTGGQGAAGPIDSGDLAGVWTQVMARVAQLGPALQGLLSHGTLVGVVDDQAVIRFGAGQDGLVKLFERNGKSDQVRDLLGQAIGRPVGVRFQVDQEDPARTPEATPAPKAGPSPASAAPASPVPPGRRRPAAAPVPTPPPTPTVRITPDLVLSIREEEPLVRELMDKLAAQIVRVE